MIRCQWTDCQRESELWVEDRYLCNEHAHAYRNLRMLREDRDIFNDLLDVEMPEKHKRRIRTQAARLAFLLETA